MENYKKVNFEVPAEMLGQRVDQALAKMLEGYSRSTIQSLIKQGLVELDGERRSQKDKVMGGEQVTIVIPELVQGEWQAQDVEFEVVHEDAHLLVVNKPAGLVVHPGAGNPDGTLLNGLLYRYPDNRNITRAGIVHRLDKDTTGLMVVARNETARLKLVEQLADHSLHREYLTLVNGSVISGGMVDEPIARDRNDRRKMSVNPLGRSAVSHYRVDQRFRRHTLLRVQLETGRTHQIRVHMAHLGFPLVGDPVYGRRLAIAGDCHPQLETELRQFKRQALHATQIEYEHPTSGQRQYWTRPLPEDMQKLVDACQLDADD